MYKLIRLPLDQNDSDHSEADFKNNIFMNTFKLTIFLLHIMFYVRLVVLICYH